MTKRNKQLYAFSLGPAFSLGIGFGFVKGTDIFDISISLGFWTIGFRTWKKGQLK